MRTLFALAALSLFAASTPPVRDFIEGQVKRGDGIHLGSKSVDVWVDGNLYTNSPDGGSLTLTPGSESNTLGTVKAAVIDAGTELVNGDLQVTGNVIASGTGTATTCTLGGQSPSTCTATVRAGSKCTCSNVGGTAAIAAAGCAVSLSSTTLTVTSANAASNVVNIHCL